MTRRPGEGTSSSQTPALMPGLAPGGGNGEAEGPLSDTQQGLQHGRGPRESLVPALNSTAMIFWPPAP